MFTDTERKTLSRVAGQVKQALEVNPYILDRWNQLPRMNLAAYRPKPPSTFGEHLGVTGRGLRDTAGNLGRAMFTGHKGGPSIMSNLYENVTSGGQDMFHYLTSGARGPKPWMADASTPMGRTWQNLRQPGRMFSDPMQRAMPDLGHAFSQAGSVGQWASKPFVDTWAALKGTFGGPRRPNT